MAESRRSWRQERLFIVAVGAIVFMGCSSEDSQKTAVSPPPSEKQVASQKESSPQAKAPSEVQKKQLAPQHHNRLADETSPYLLMHAHNPVDWQPWDDKALEQAKAENKIIFLSVGYSSCHWCHVMERESFLDEEIAAFLNEHFICIKVDREERPDIDQIYMTSLHIYNQLTGSGRGGGWPMSMFLTPEGKPFFGGTYFPARDGDRGSSTGFLTIIQKLAEHWKTNSEGARETADQLTQFTKTELERRRGFVLTPLDKKVLDDLRDSLSEQFDEKHGGFGFSIAEPMRPKFPEPSNLIFLIERIKQLRLDKKDASAELTMLTGTLNPMARGGIRDHLGGGFHRYSVDRFWRIPHFEKMLYDNGQLASVYAEAYQLTGREEYRHVCEELLEFVIREMTSPEKGFYSALDAESEGEEGIFYSWEKEQLQQLLSSDEFELLASVYGVDQEPNFEEDYHVLQWSQTFAETAKSLKLSPQELHKRLQPIRQKLLAVRVKRPRPLTDTKILTSWNGLMIRGFADAGRILGNEDYLKAARQGADFVLTQLRTDEGRLLRTYGQGQARLNAYLNDYAFFVDGLIALYRATGEKKWLTAADELTRLQIELFWDEANGGFFFTSSDHESLLARAKDPVDGVQPAGNSVAADNLIYLASALKHPEYLKKAGKTIQATADLLQNTPAAVPRLAVAFAALQKAKANNPKPPEQPKPKDP